MTNYRSYINRNKTNFCQKFIPEAEKDTPSWHCHYYIVITLLFYCNYMLYIGSGNVIFIKTSNIPYFIKTVIVRVPKKLNCYTALRRELKCCGILHRVNGRLNT